jgi:hypothetical protein
MLFDLSIALRLHHDLSKVISLTPRSRDCEIWVPLGPQRPGSRPSPTSGSGLIEDRRPVSGPNRPSWQPTGPPEDLTEDFRDDLIHHDLKTQRTEQDLVDYDQSRSTGYGKTCNIDLGLLVVTDQEFGN